MFEHEFTSRFTKQQTAITYAFIVERFQNREGVVYKTFYVEDGGLLFCNRALTYSTTNRN